MKKRKTVAGVTAPAPRPTVLGAFILACLVTAPLGTVILLVDWIWF